MTRRTLNSVLLFPLVNVTTIGAFATPVTYRFAFTLDTTTGFGPILPDSGEFAYDVAAPLASRFSAFTVAWNKNTFDLTDEANAGGELVGTLCGTTPDPSAVFSFLTGNGVCSGSNTIGWFASNVPFVVANRGAAFGFYNLTGTDLIRLSTPLQPPAGGLSLSSGFFEATAVPEPSYSGILLFAGSVFVGLKRLAARG